MIGTTGSNVTIGMGNASEEAAEEARYNFNDFRLPNRLGYRTDAFGSAPGVKGYGQSPHGLSLTHLRGKSPEAPRSGLFSSTISDSQAPCSLESGRLTQHAGRFLEQLAITVPIGYL